MQALNQIARQIITNFNAGSVATVNDDGTAAVSPKGTFVIVDDKRIAFGDIRSPATVANIRKRPTVEVLFTDILTRRAVRVRGNANVVATDSEQGIEVAGLLEEQWQPFYDLMKHFVIIDISEVQLVSSPAYDIGLTEAELVDSNLEKLNKLRTTS